MEKTRIEFCCEAGPCGFVIARPLRQLELPHRWFFAVGDNNYADARLSLLDPKGHAPNVLRYSLQAPLRFISNRLSLFPFQPPYCRSSGQFARDRWPGSKCQCDGHLKVG